MTIIVRRITRRKEGHSTCLNSAETPAKKPSSAFSCIADMPGPICRIWSSSDSVASTLSGSSESSTLMKVVSPVRVVRVGRACGGRIFSSGRSSSGRSDVVFFGSYLAIRIGAGRFGLVGQLRRRLHEGSCGAKRRRVSTGPVRMKHVSIVVRRIEGLSTRGKTVMKGGGAGELWSQNVLMKYCTKRYVQCITRGHVSASEFYFCFELRRSFL